MSLFAKRFDTSFLCFKGNWIFISSGVCNTINGSFKTHLDNRSPVNRSNHAETLSLVHTMLVLRTYSGFFHYWSSLLYLCGHNSCSFSYNFQNMSCTGQNYLLSKHILHSFKETHERMVRPPVMLEVLKFTYCLSFLFLFFL